MRFIGLAITTSEQLCLMRPEPQSDLLISMLAEMPTGHGRIFLRFIRARHSCHRKAQAKHCAVSVFALDFDLAAVFVYDLAHDEETKTRAAPARLRRVERIGNVRRSEEHTSAL